MYYGIRYNYSNIFIIDGRTFVTILRTAGVPASLNTVTNKRGEAGPLLKPYPDWSWYGNDNNCNGIINVFRVAVSIFMKTLSKSFFSLIISITS